MKNLMKTLLVCVLSVGFSTAALAEVKVGGYALNEPFKPFGVEQYTNYNRAIYSVPVDKSATSVEKKYFKSVNIPVSPLAPTMITAKGTFYSEKDCTKAFNAVKEGNIEKFGKDGLKYKPVEKGGDGDIYLYTSGMFQKDDHIYQSKLACLLSYDDNGGRAHQLYYELETKQ